MFDDKKEALLEALKEFSDPKYREKMQKTFDEIEKLNRDLTIVVFQVKLLAGYDSNKNMEKARKLYENLFLKTGNLRIKGALSEHEIQKLLDKKGFARLLQIRLETAQVYIGRVIGPCKKAFESYNKIAGYANSGSRVLSKLALANTVSSSEEYRKYFREIGDDFISVASAMKSISNYLPPGARTYCDFVFTAAEACKGAFEVVDNYAEKINTLAKEAFDSLGKTVRGNEKNHLSGLRILKAGGDEKAMDAEWGK